MDPASEEVSPAKQRDLGSIVFRNMLVASLGGWVNRIASFLFIVYAVRVLGEAELGRYATVVAFVGLLSVFAELGLAQYVEREIARDSNNANDLFWNLVAIRLLLGIAGIIVISGLAFAIYEPRVAFGTVLLSLTFILSAFFIPLKLLLTANERFDYSTVLNLVGQLSTVVLRIILLWMGMGFYALLITGFITMPLQIIMAVKLIRRAGLGPVPFRINTDTWTNLMRKSIPFGVTSLALLLNFSVDTVILSIFRPPEDVGWYTAGYRLVFNVTGIVSGFLLVMTPSLAREHALDPERVRRWVRSSLRWLLIFSLPAGAGLALLSTRVVVLLYGENFREAGPVLALVAWDIPLVMMLGFMGNVTSATGLEKPAAKIFVASALSNVVLNLLFIPQFGMMGAAAITVVSDMITVVALLILLRENFVWRMLSSDFARAVLATVLMMAWVSLVRDQPLAVVVAMGGMFYLLVAIGLRLVEISTLRLIAGRVFRRVRSQQATS